ncbi:coiled-coil domain-containing protein [Mycoplasma parvum]|uniref:Uncharacterized protein n=1 Tax=Mycoplasma parvum str. Indiana TaxID=1403316 RepID=U5NFX7_9MOLU|nr:hypothetical protein [Mycoplasma parvum]AGX89153.1 hypothetical protein PRV_02075 [Mycoplasma parvum str. Indiana]
MFFPSKLISLTTTSLGALGLSSYLIPYELSNLFPNLQKIFSKNKSFYEQQNIKEFINKQKEILEKLESLFHNLSNGINAANTLKEQKSIEIKNTLDLIFKIEGEIDRLYKESVKVVEILNNLMEILSKQEKDKLENQTKLHELKQINQLSSSLKDYMSNMQKTIKEFKKIISDATQKNLKNNQSTDISGGAKSAGDEAKEKLKEIETTLSDKDQQLDKSLYKVNKSLMNLYLTEIKIEQIILDLEKSIVFLNLLSNFHNINLKFLNFEINEFIKKLNESRRDLQKFHEEWEVFKSKLFEFKNYEGIVKNSICINTQYKEKEKCDKINSERKII